MSDSRIYAKFAIIISDHPGKKEAAIEFIGLHGWVIRESIFKTTRGRQRCIR
jgi:hypothetical protein